jgi:AmiR/NasT family two-component response regulator
VDQPAAPTEPAELTRWNCVDSSAEVAQAAGAVTVQMGVSINEAGIQLRVHAAAANRPLMDVACDIIARRLRLTSPNETD